MGYRKRGPKPKHLLLQVIIIPAPVEAPVEAFPLRDSRDLGDKDRELFHSWIFFFFFSLRSS